MKAFNVLHNAQIKKMVEVHVAQGLYDALLRCKFNSEGMSLGDVQFIRDALNKADGEEFPTVGTRVAYPTGTGTVKLPPDRNGTLIVEDDSGEDAGTYKRVAARACRPTTRLGQTAKEQDRKELVQEIHRIKDAMPNSCRLSCDEWLAECLINESFRNR